MAMSAGVDSRRLAERASPLQPSRDTRPIENRHEREHCTRRSHHDDQRRSGCCCGKRDDEQAAIWRTERCEWAEGGRVRGSNGCAGLKVSEYGPDRPQRATDLLHADAAKYDAAANGPDVAPNHRARSPAGDMPFGMALLIAFKQTYPCPAK